jgi:holliday junction DNA helicase RuvA
MIALLRGVLLEKDLNRALVDVHGVGYELQIPLSTYDKLPREGAEVTLRTYLHVREDALILFGFVTEPEKLLFHILFTVVSGIGPKLAINVLSAMSVEQFAVAVRDRDLKALAKISGIGKRSAERLAVELKDKLNAVAPAIAAGGSAGAAGNSASQALNAAATDAVSALVQLGFKQEQAQATIRDLLDELDPAAVSAPDLIRRGLARIRGN